MKQIHKTIMEANKDYENATIFAYPVNNPERYGENLMKNLKPFIQENQLNHYNCCYRNLFL